jgi:chromate reductase
MNVLVISGSSRRGSLNTRLAHLVAELCPADSARVVSDLFRLPFFDADLEAAGTPAAVGELRAAVEAADLVVFSTPEYNGTIPGVLANALDWLSRPHGQSVLRSKTVLVLSASPSPGGATSAAAHLRHVLTRIGADVVDAGLSVAAAHRRLAADPDPQLVTDLNDQLTDVLGPASRSVAA